MMKAKILKASIFSAGAYGLVKALQPWFNTWGATDYEKSMSLPGEEKVRTIRIGATHAITIQAPPEEIWPWLVQMGSGRGGFYSYSWIENLVGCEVRNANRILPEFQNLKESSEVYLHPKAPPLRVTKFEQNKTLALEGWIFHLEPVGKNQTRLITRTYVVPPPMTDSVAWRYFVKTFNTVAFDLAHFIMGQKQLRQIKKLVEKNRQLKVSSKRLSLGSDKRPAFSL